MVEKDDLAELASPDAGLLEALRQLRGKGLRDGSGPDPLLSALVPPEVLSRFLVAAVQEARDDTLVGLALTLPACIYRRGAGQEALELVLTGGRLPDWAGRYVEAHLEAQHTAARERLGQYASPEQAARLLEPATGPGTPGVLAGLALLAARHPAPRPYQLRLQSWIHEGRFDQGGDGDAGELLRILGDGRDEPGLRPHRAALHARIVDRLEDPATGDAGVHPVEAAAAVGYACADELVGDLARATVQLGEAARARFDAALSRLETLAR